MDDLAIENSSYLYVKRLFDFILACVLFGVSLPIILLFMIFIRLESKGPAIYKQERVGFRGKPITIYKLRSMRIDAEKNGAQWAQKEDPRVTRVGCFIRKTRIDELPQLISVIKGDMSLIGPRPERQVFIDKFKQDIPDFDNRLLVPPGLSGWAQVNGGYDVTPKQKFDLDMEYIREFGFKKDFEIFFKTIQIVFNGNGAR